MYFLRFISRLAGATALCWAVAATAVRAQAPAQTTINFMLARNYSTSARVYANNGTLVRTLWRGIDYTAGPHQTTWDGFDDEGHAMPAATYQVKVLTHNVRYVWEGVVGNTLASFTRDVWRSILGMYDATFAGTGGLVATGYNEGQPGLKRFGIATPQTAMDAVAPDRNSVWVAVATDGNKFYAASNNSGWDTDNSNFASGHPGGHWRSCGPA